MTINISLTFLQRVCCIYNACAVYNCTEFEMSPVSTTSTTSPVSPPPTCLKTANDGRPGDAVRNLDGNGDN